MTVQRSLLLVVACVGTGCGVDLTVPPGTTVSCTDTSECPDGFVCKQSIASCVRIGSDDTVPEVVAGSITPQLQYVHAGGTATVSFVVSKDMTPPPDVRLEWSGASPVERSMQQVSHDAATRSYTYAYLAAAGDPQDWATVVIRLVDDNGNQGRGEQTRSVLFDFAPPGVATDIGGTALVSLQYLPSATNLRRDVSAATTGTTIRVAFTVQEQLVSDPVVHLSGSPAPPFGLRSRTGLSYIYEQVWASALAEETPYPLIATLTDLAGNPADVELDVVDIDTIAPPGPAVGVANAVVYERVPWGNEGSNGRPTFTLAGAAGATSGAAEVIVLGDVDVFDGAGTYVGREVTRIAPRPDGGFGGALGSASPFVLPTTDRAQMYVLAVDASGNPSDASGAAGVQASLVHDVAWTATLIGKVPGSTLQNPHAFEVRRLFGAALTQSDSVPLPTIGSVGRLDATLATSHGEGSWREMSPSVPSFRAGMAFSYDSLRQRHVMWGGVGYFTCDNTNYCDLFEGRGLRWTTPTESDPEGDGTAPRGTGFVSTFDSVRGVTVVFTGSELWEWNGSSWRNGTPAAFPSPAPAAGAQLAYDRAHRRVLLFGGATSTLWGYDGTSVSSVCNAASCGTAPAARVGHGMAYDEARETLVVFGGATAGGSQADTWEWSAAGGWSQPCAGGCPGGAPGARKNHRMAYDAGRGVTVLFGGELPATCGGDPCTPRDTWEWDGNGWDPVCTSGGCLLSSPDARVGHGLAYDVERQRVVLAFGQPVPGGFNCDGSPIFCQGVWEWDGAVWTLLNDNTLAPYGRTGTALAVDPVAKKVILFGGATTNNSCWVASPSLNAETWRWTGERWRQLSPVTSPAARCGHSMGTVNAGGSSTMVLFGGITGASTDGTTWLWDGSNWTRRCENVPVGDTCLAVAARQGAALGNTPSGNRVMLVGGSSDTNDFFQSSTQTNSDYLWSTSPWATTCTSGACIASRPDTRIGSPIAYDSVNNVNVLFGGMTESIGLSNTTFTFSGTSWSPVNGGSPPARAFHGLVYDPNRRATILFGGSLVGPALETPTCTGASSVCNDTWELAGGVWTERHPVDPDSDGNPSGNWSAQKPYETPMVLDPVTGRLLMFSAQDGDTWLYETGGASRPGHVFGAVFDAAQADPASLVTDIQVLWNGGGSGAPAGVGTSGATLLVWNSDHWEPLVANATASPASPASLQWQLTTDVTWASATVGQKTGLFIGPAKTMYLALTPSVVAGTGTNMGSIVTDYVEVTVRYRLP